MLMDPALHMKARMMARELVSNLLGSIGDRHLSQGLIETADLLDNDRPFDALKKVRTMLPLEAAGVTTEERSKEVA